MPEITIVYASAGGNTKMVCDKVAEVLSSAHNVHLHNARLAKPSVLTEGDILILASPTYGQGDLEQYMARLIKQVTKLDLEQRPCAVIGLGDFLYEPDYLVESAKMLEDFIKEHNGKLIVPPLQVVQNPIKQLNVAVTRWSEKLLEELNKNDN